MGNIGLFMVDILKILVSLPSKLYSVLTYKVNIKWLADLLDFFKVKLDLPSSISLLAIIGSLGAVTLVAIIVYNIFKL